MAEKSDMNKVIRASRGITVEQGQKRRPDMNTLIRRGFGVRVEQQEEDDEDD